MNNIETFINSFPSNEIFNDEQDILINKDIKAVNFNKFIHSDETDLKNNWEVMPIATLWPNTDSSIFIGIHDDVLISYSIDTCKTYMTTATLNDLKELISSHTSNQLIFNILFENSKS